MVVMKTLSDSTKCDKQVLGGVDVLIIGLVTPHVCGTVHEPCEVQGQAIPKDSADEVCIPQTLAPVVPRDDGGQHETQQQHRRQVQSENIL